LAGRPLTTGVLAAFTAFFLWGLASHAFGAVQDIRADQGGGIASVATWLGAAPTVRMAVGLYTAAGLVLLLGTAWPGRLSGLLAAPYVANIVPYVAVADRDCETANAGWRRFLTLNYVTGFLVTQLFIVMALGT
jgi:4-hydroxybenzoate polyprenyltransferase